MNDINLTMNQETPVGDNEHTRTAGAIGIFVTERSMSAYTKALFLQEEGTETPVLVRFSTKFVSIDSPVTTCDPRGFDVKFYTKQGHYDLVGSHLPAYIMGGAINCSDRVHALNPATYREMNGYGVHAVKWMNEAGESIYVRYTWKSLQCVRHAAQEKVSTMHEEDFNYAMRDLYGAIATESFPQWALHVQLMPAAEVDLVTCDPLDSTKLWPEDRYPLQEVGTLTLNRNPVNYFGEVERSSFAVDVTVSGIELIEDK